MSNDKKSKILLIKNLSGSFNDQHIGHEVINLYCDDNGDAYFYIPPYGSIGPEQKSFYKSDLYKNIEKIFVFDDVNITNIYKLKQVIINPIKFKSFDEMKDTAGKVSYANKLLKDIDFGDQSYLEAENKSGIKDLENEDMKVFLLSYKLDKDKVFDFEKDNYFIYVKSSNVKNNLKEKSLEAFRTIYGENAKIDEVDIVLGQKQYSYNNLTNLEKWYQERIESECVSKRKMKYKKVPTTFESEYDYDENNFLSFVRKTSDENYYSNYINGILNSNIELLKKFFSYLIDKLYGVKDYNPNNVKCLIQAQAMTNDMKLWNKIINCRLVKSFQETKDSCQKEINKLKKKYNYKEKEIFECISEEKSKDDLMMAKFIDGQMDLYLYDDNYRIVIENKILSGLNGKHDEISKEINQLVTYDKYLNHLNRRKQKNNKVVILCPYCLQQNFANYKVAGYKVPRFTYRDLADFFSKNSGLIIEKYREDFIKTINRQALTKEELITYRFIKTINS